MIELKNIFTIKHGPDLIIACEFTNGRAHSVTVNWPMQPPKVVRALLELLRGIENDTNLIPVDPKPKENPKLASRYDEPP